LPETGKQTCLEKRGYTPKQRGGIDKQPEAVGKRRRQAGEWCEECRRHWAVDESAPARIKILAPHPMQAGEHVVFESICSMRAAAIKLYQQSRHGRQLNIPGDDDPKAAFIHKLCRRMGHPSEHINIKGKDTGTGQIRRHGQLELSNNLAENAIRPVAVGRNYEQSGIMQSSTGSDRDFGRWALGTVESTTAPVFA
jgi:hypothetical protein